MLQVARLASRQLGESRDLVAQFIRARLNPDGGFQDRAGASDLYYTVFGLDALIALQEDVPAGPTSAFLASRATAADLDFVHVACLARGWAALRRLPDAPVADDLLARLERCRAADGGYANHPDLPVGLTPSTAAAVLVMRHLGAAPDRDAGMWLLDRCHARGGFFAAPAAPVPDLLSTATALHALSSLHVPIGGLAEPCLDFLDSLWTNRGGFYGTWADAAPDCEYTYYALLALGHLTLESS